MHAELLAKLLADALAARHGAVVGVVDDDLPAVGVELAHLVVEGAQDTRAQRLRRL